MDMHISSKTTLTASSGAAATIIIWILQTGGIDIPAEVAAAIVTIITGIVAYLVPAKSGKYVYTEPVIPESELIDDTSATNGNSDYDDPDQTLGDPDEFPEFQDALYDAEHDDSGAPVTVSTDGKAVEGGIK